MKMNERTILASSAAWIAAVLVLLAATAALWSLSLVARLVLSMALLALAITICSLFFEFIEWVETELDTGDQPVQLDPPPPMMFPVPAPITAKPPDIPRTPTRIVIAEAPRDRISRHHRRAGGRGMKPVRPPKADVHAQFERWKQRRHDVELKDAIEEVQRTVSDEITDRDVATDEVLGLGLLRPEDGETPTTTQQAVQKRKYPMLPDPGGVFDSEGLR